MGSNPNEDLEDAKLVIARATTAYSGTAPPTVAELTMAAVTLQRELHRAQRDLDSLLNAFDREQRRKMLRGDRLVRSREAGVQRHLLAGQPLYPGNTVCLLTLGGWLPARYECVDTPDGRLAADLFIFIPGVGTVSESVVRVRLPDGALLAWPEEVDASR